jgi:hypothetical protein
MSARFEKWANRKVTRDELGRFSETAAGHAARLLADAAVPGRSVSRMYRQGARPEGFEHLVGRWLYLGNIPASSVKGGLGRERTDEEQDEQEQIESALNTFHDAIGLRGQKYPEDYRRQFPDSHDVYDPRGNVIESKDPDAPIAAQRGFKRVADLPKGHHYTTRSTHPLANGIWIDPKNPGTKRQPNYVSDYNTLIGADTARSVGLQYADTTHSKRWKDGRTDRRTASFEHDEFGDPLIRLLRRSGGEWRERVFGGRGSLEQDFTTGMKWDMPKDFRERMQAKGKRKRQRTWIEKLNARMEGER